MSWAEHYKEIKSVLPCSELHIALYLQHLTEICKHHSTVESAFYSIKWAHDVAGLHNPCKSDLLRIKVITKLPNSEQSYKGKVKTHNYINRQNQSTAGKL